MIPQAEFDKAVEALKELEFKFDEQRYIYDKYIDEVSVYNELSTYNQNYSSSLFRTHINVSIDLNNSIKELKNVSKYKGKKEMNYEFVRSKVKSILCQFEQLVKETKAQPGFIYL